VIPFPAALFRPGLHRNLSTAATSKRLCEDVEKTRREILTPARSISTSTVIPVAFRSGGAKGIGILPIQEFAGSLGFEVRGFDFGMILGERPYPFIENYRPAPIEEPANSKPVPSEKLSVAYPNWESFSHQGSRHS